MILPSEYFGQWIGCDDVTDTIKDNATELLHRVNALLNEAFSHGVDLVDNPVTSSLISGAKYGGFRPQECTIGAMYSAHKTAEAVDIYDPLNALDNWLTDEILTKFDLYREAPLATKGWCHLTCRPPRSGRRTFQP